MKIEDGMPFPSGEVVDQTLDRLERGMLSHFGNPDDLSLCAGDVEVALVLPSARISTERDISNALEFISH